MSRHHSRHAFTLTELLVALGVGLIVLNAAFVVFVNTGKFFKRIESIGTKSDIAQSMILWNLAQKDPSKYPFVPDPTNTGNVQFRLIGAAKLTSQPNLAPPMIPTAFTTAPADPNGRYLNIVILDFTAKAVVQPTYLVIPTTGF